MDRAAFPLDLDADLRVVDPGGRELTLRARGGQGTVVLPRSALTLRGLRSLGNRAARRRLAGYLHRAIATVGLRLEVKAAGRVVARMTPEGSGSWSGRILGLDPVEVRLAGVVGALLFPRPQ